MPTQSESLIKSNGHFSHLWHQYPTALFGSVFFNRGGRGVCVCVCVSQSVSERVPQFRLFCDIQSKYDSFYSPLLFFPPFFPFLFVHVAQLSIALGRHTLPHVRVWKGAKDGGKTKEVDVQYNAVMLRGLLFRLCCCFHCWYYTKVFKKRIMGYGSGLQNVPASHHLTNTL